MDTHKIERLAKVSRVLGILSTGFLLLTFFIAIWIRFSDVDIHKKLALFINWAGVAFLGSLVTGIPGCVTAFITRRRNKDEGGDPNISRMATTSLILCLLGIVATTILFVDVFDSLSNDPRLFVL